LKSLDFGKVKFLKTKETRRDLFDVQPNKKEAGAPLTYARIIEGSILPIIIILV